MRKAQKKDILDMIQTLHEAHEEIKNHIDRNNTVSAQDLLAQCQECAVSIGNAIETMEKEDCITIPYIQDYCDLVYQIYEALQNNTDSSANKIYKNLKKQLLRIENSVKNDIPVRKEVAFFTYKASMWDSLESVYLAAKEDPECDAYCVPIPYYDRNPDRSLGQMHYEGNEYPKNIEVIDWQSYNFEERKPDAIYIHNPYDDWNLVTCVHPRFFSSNLKKYTEKLVYIPYFVLDEIEPDDQPRIDGMKHFIWTPGVINADKVIVQSEKMKQIYVNEYLKAAQANGLQGNHLDRKYLEEKFLGLGSPKIDKVLNTKKEDLEIPKEWLKIIQKPDGSWKKIIFYNTSIAALLENNEKMLEKMKDVFRVFYENKDEVALLWRPHPLIKSTVSSMRPQLWTEYEKLVKQYKEEGWGIYDDSSDMDRAVVLSDAYYGDASSVVTVYQKTKKIIGIQDANGDEKKVAASAVILIDRDIWFSAANRNGLFKYNYDLKKLECVGIFKGEKINAQFLHSEIKKYKNKLIFIPFQANYIDIYDIENDTFEIIEIPLTDRGQKYSKFYKAIQEEHIIYFIPCRYGVLVEYNAKINKAYIIEEPFENNRSYPISIKAGCKVEEHIYIASFTTGVIEEFNLVTKEKKQYYINYCKNGISNMEYHKGCFWIANNDGDLIIWYKDTQKTEMINVCNKAQVPHAIYEILCNEDKVYLASSTDKKIFKYDISQRRIETVYLEEPTEKLFPKLWADFCALTVISKEKIGFYSTTKAQFIIIGNKTEMIEWNFCSVVNNYYKKIKEKYEYEDMEGISMSIDEFLCLLSIS